MKNTVIYIEVYVYRIVLNSDIPFNTKIVEISNGEN